MAERTDRQAQIDPWAQYDELKGMPWNSGLGILQSVASARAADAALLRERDAQIAELTKAVQGNALAVVKANDAASQQIASLTAQVEQQTQGYTLKGLSNYFGWGLESDRDVWQFAASREHTLRLAQELLETSRSDAGTAADAIRDRIERVVPGFERFNERIRDPGGFALPHGPRDGRRFNTDSGRAAFAVTEVAVTDRPAGQLTLQTLRSHDQYNTTIYGFDDRYRGISGNRHVIMVNAADIAELGFHDGDLVDIISVFPDRERRVRGYQLIGYPTPRGSAAAYYPETNVLVALDHQSAEAGTPASKSIPIRLEHAHVGASRP